LFTYQFAAVCALSDALSRHLINETMVPGDWLYSSVFNMAIVSLLAETGGLTAGFHTISCHLDTSGKVISLIFHQHRHTPTPTSNLIVPHCVG
jgi:hypothetical protein